MKKIKKCPFCGGVADLCSNYSNRDVFWVYVRCNVCSARGRAYASEEDPAEEDWEGKACEMAVDIWNNRTKADE